MKSVTSIEYKDLDFEEKRKVFKYATGDPAKAMRRFFAERGDKIWLVPTRIWTDTYKERRRKRGKRNRSQIVH